MLAINSHIKSVFVISVSSFRVEYCQSEINYVKHENCLSKTSLKGKSQLFVYGEFLWIQFLQANEILARSTQTKTPANPISIAISRGSRGEVPQKIGELRN